MKSASYYFLRWLRPKPLNPALQVFAMKWAYPNFEARRHENGYLFRGRLKPTDDSRIFVVTVKYSHGSHPKVYVNSPSIDEEAPHTYRDGSLCLFHPCMFYWHDGLRISSYIIPWVAYWLYFYEKWLELGVWLGPEAPHFKDSKPEPL